MTIALLTGFSHPASCTWARVVCFGAVEARASWFGFLLEAGSFSLLGAVEAFDCVAFGCVAFGCVALGLVAFGAVVAGSSVMEVRWNRDMPKLSAW